MNKKADFIFKSVIFYLNLSYIANIVINNIFLQKDVTNSLINTYGTIGFVLTFLISILMSGGAFMISTIIQIVVYHLKNKKIYRCFISLFILEAIKIIGTFTYIFTIDTKNINFMSRPLSSAFIITGIIIFIFISIFEIIYLSLNAHLATNKINP